MITPRPLFITPYDPNVETFSVCSDESCCIEKYLLSLPPQCHALRSHDTISNLLTLLGTSSSIALPYFERFLLWCFCIKQKPVASLTAYDMNEYLRFYQNPESDWINYEGRQPRFFVPKDKAAVFNEEWKPFPVKISKTLGAMHSYLCLVADFVSGDQRATIRPPKLSHFQDIVTELSYKEVVEQSLIYLTWLVDICPHTKNAEKKLFLFATCFHLKMASKDLSASLPFFSKACFASQEDAIVFQIPTRRGILVRRAPEEYMEYFDRYCKYAEGLARRQIGHNEPLVDRRVARHSIGFPAMNNTYASPTTLLRINAKHYDDLDVSLAQKAAIFSVHKQETCNINRLRQFSRINLNKRLDTLYAEALVEQIKTETRPIPLYKFPINIERSDDHLNRAGACRMVVNNALALFKDQHLQEIEDFFTFAASEDGSGARLRLKAYETALLWSVLIKRRPLSDLMPKDIEQFYKFCICPPKTWASNSRPVRRFLRADVHHENLAWSPFLAMSAGENANAVKAQAGRAVLGCYRVQQALIEMGLLGANIFAPLSRDIWSLRPLRF
ncbi:hypothetical protein ACYZUA_17260 [Pseudomonas sp. LS2P72]